MKVLGLDSATWTASVGVVDGEQILAERSTPATTSHAVSLVGLIDATLADAGLGIGDLDLMAVSIGPGSFTGLRIGLSVAKGLSLATGVPLVAVPTLEALARVARGRSGVICAALDARKGEVYMAAFRDEGETMETVIAPAAVSLDQFLLRLPSPCTIVGDAIEAYEGRLRPRLGPGVEILPFTRVAPRGSVVASLGRRRFAVAGAVSLEVLEPVYIRPSEAELNTRQGQTRSGGSPRIVESNPAEQN